MIIEVKNAGFSYDGIDDVFDGVGLSVNKGEILSILGPNGCGKTTLLKCINALLKLGKGEIRIEGNSVSSLKRTIIGKRVGYVPQASDSTFPYTVQEMVLMGRAPHLSIFSSPAAKDIELAEDALKTLGISHLTSRPYTNLSGGQAQLVLIARALAAEPQALLLDEPTSHLDFRNQMIILNILERLSQEQKMAIIMTTHYPDHALSISDKALLMGNGKGGSAGDTKDMLTERNLREVFEIDVRLISFEDRGENIEAIIPLRKTLQ